MLYIIFKDLYQSKKMILLYMLIGTAIILSNYANETGFAMISFYIYIMVYGVVSRNEYNEDKNGGYTLLRTLPIKPYKIVVGKFITTVVLITIGVLVSVLVVMTINKSILIGYAERISILAGVSFSLLFSGFLYILIYRFGAAKAINISRILFLALIFIPSLLIPFIVEKLPKPENIDLDKISITLEKFIVNLNPSLTLLMVLLIYVIMMLISISIFENRKAV